MPLPAFRPGSLELGGVRCPSPFKGLDGEVQILGLSNKERWVEVQRWHSSRAAYNITSNANVIVRRRDDSGRWAKRVSLVMEWNATQAWVFECGSRVAFSQQAPKPLQGPHRCAPTCCMFLSRVQQTAVSRSKRAITCGGQCCSRRPHFWVRANVKSTSKHHPASTLGVPGEIP